MRQRPRQVLLRFCVIWTRRKCFCTWPKVFAPKLYQKSKKRSDSFNEPLDSGTHLSDASRTGRESRRSSTKKWACSTCQKGPVILSNKHDLAVALCATGAAQKGVRLHGLAPFSFSSIHFLPSSNPRC